MARKNSFLSLKEAANRGFYDEYPMLNKVVDPQIHLSRNDRRQPFWLICAKDTVVVQMTGTADIEFKKAEVDRFHMKPGDLIYVPAGVPHRLDPHKVSIHMRYKATLPGNEAIVWFCEKCGNELDRDIWDAEVEHSQSHFLAGCESFNASETKRTCGACGIVHPPVDISGNKWAEVARELEAEDEPV